MGKLKHFSFLSAWSLQKLETLGFQAGELERLSSGMCRNLNIWGTSTRGDSTEAELMAGLGMAFLALRGLLGIQSETSEEFHHSQFGGA